jgi:hypothetical protein
MPTNIVAASILSLQIVLPAFNQFAEKAGLDIQLPLEEKRVTRSYVGKKSASLMATFDQRHQFNWFSVHGNTFQGRIYYEDLEASAPRRSDSQSRELTKRPSLISTNEAKELGDRCLKNLGFDFRKIKAGAPHVGQYTYQDKPEDERALMPFFGIRWFPKGKKKPEWHDILVEMEVSGLTKKIVRFTPSPRADKAVAVDLRGFMTNRTENPRGSQ